MELAAVVSTFGGSRSDVPTPSVHSVDAWLDAAAGRPVWQLWGKGRPNGSCPAHPLLCHILDVAAVAALLLTRVSTPALRRRLLGLHPGGEEASLRLLLFVIALHDLGKATPAFQSMLEWACERLPALGFDLDAPDNARHHGDVGFGFLRDALRARGIAARPARALARAVTAHHGEFPTDQSLGRKPSSAEAGKSPRWAEARETIVAELAAFFGVTADAALAIGHPDVALLAGFTSVADWVGSMDDVFVYEPPQPSLAAYWPRALARAATALERAGMRDAATREPRSFAELFAPHTPWPLHATVDSLAQTLSEPALVVVEAPMGEGKTEAALLLADAAAARLGQQGLYIGLPTQATSNQMFGRVQAYLERTRGDVASNLVLAHGEASLDDRFQKICAVYDRGASSSGAVRAESWFLSKKRTLLAEYAVGTIDQALLSVMRTSHAFVRLYGLAGKTVVLDEVHAYDMYTGTLLDRLVEWLAAMGATVLLLSATLPSSRRAALVKAYQRGAGLAVGESAPAAAYPRVTLASRRGAGAQHFAPRGRSVAVAVEQHDDDIDAIASKVVEAARRGGCVGWICNTVARAQAARRAVQRLAGDIPGLLLHSRLLPEERTRRERELETKLGPQRAGIQRPERYIVIGTQVLEQSLDVDFDLLFTDLAPVDLVLQRMGRLFRHVRTNRAAAFQTPRVVIVRPEGPWERVRLDDVAVVYAEALVRGTLRALAARTTITLPDDIEPLVEEVYREIPPDPADPLFDARVEHLGVTLAQRQDAMQRLMPRPTVEDDPFGDLRVYFDDDEDPGLHAQLKAQTRLGSPSVEMVCLVKRGDAVFAGDAECDLVDLDAVPDRVAVQRLVRRSIGITRPAVVRALLAEESYRPKAWAQSALLRHRRAVVFEDGAADVGGTRLTLDSDLGLCMERG